MRQCLLHIVVALAMAIEEPKIQPRAGTSATGFNGGPVFGFRRGNVFLFFRDASTYPVRASGIESGQWGDLLYGLIAPAAHNPLRFQVELGKIAAGFHTVRIKFDGSLEFGSNASGQSGRS